MQIKTVSAILVWVAIALLILNAYVESLWIFFACVVLVIVAVTVYFIPRLMRRRI